MSTLIASLITLLLTALAATPPVLLMGATPMGFLLAVAVLSLGGVRLPPLVVAALSLVADSLSGAPLGLHGVVALLMLWSMKRIAPAFALQTLLIQSMAVGLLLAVAQMGMMALLWLLGQESGLWSALLSWVVTVPLVPLVLWGVRLVMQDRKV